MTFTFSRRMTAEWLGTLLLVATVVGSGIMADKLSGGNVALALLANTLATGAILVVLISVLGPVSGAHFNPVVTLVDAIAADLPPAEAVGYAAVQVVGGIFGAWLAHAMFALPLLQLSATIRTGSAQWLAEFVATFGLLATILLGRRQAPAAVPMLVGLYITAAYWFTASTSFANPAVTVARAMTNTFAGIFPSHVAMFIAAQIAGALAALWLCRWILAPAKRA